MIPTDWLPDPYILILTGFGLLIALVTWLPLALKKLPLSLPIVCIGIGAAIFSFPQVTLRPLPTLYPEITERFTEFLLIIALMGAGLKIDRIFRWREWAITWRLLAITMPLGILAITVLVAWSMGLPWAIALLLAASLAPTDPVLASDVQVGPPKSGEEDEVRFGLTSEAGLNDGLAFPFVHLGIVMATVAATEPDWLLNWFGYRVLWEIGAGVAIGWVVGRLFGWLTFHMPSDNKIAATGDGLIALSATLVSYGVAEVAHSYGFLAVFVCALSIRHSHRNHEFQREMHDIAEQIERIAMMVLLLLLGGALVSGILDAVGWTEIGLAIVILLIVRPVTGLIGLAGFRADRSEKLTIAFFGIRGAGSVYYLSYGLNHLEWGDPERLWGLVALVIVMSILLHGLTVTPVMRFLDRRRGRDPDADEDEIAEPSVR